MKMLSLCCVLIGMAGAGVFGWRMWQFFFVPETGGEWNPVALALDGFWVLLFGACHSIMARRSWKESWSRVLPGIHPRLGYVFFTGLCLAAIGIFWQPSGPVVWIAGDWGGWLMLLGWLAGWGITGWAALLMDAADLAGLRALQAGKDQPDLPLKSPALYKVVRHPIYLGLLMTFWLLPCMSADRLLFAGVMTIYILIAIRLEEKDLLAKFGDSYREYRKQVPMILPFWRNWAK